MSLPTDLDPDRGFQSARDVRNYLNELRREIDSGEHPDVATPRQVPAPDV